MSALLLVPGPTADAPEAGAPPRVREVGSPRAGTGAWSRPTPPARRAVPCQGARATTRRPAAGTLRLTRRGRVVLVMVAAMLLVGLAFVAGRGSASAAPTTPPPTTSVQVRPGDTLWSLARRVAPAADPRSTVDRIAAANGLPEGARLLPGQVLRLP
jgi:nucleoid-associated protein YgaU